jgi:pimeloyl-ACP methyl ester carboxylesterase
VVHGAGGGFDQGELLASAIVGDGFHRITPSRFGYLRSTNEPNATWDDQAHAYAALLDHLGITKAAVVAFSAGGSSGLLLALLHPDRVSSLTLVSCGGAKVPKQEDVLARKQGDALLAIVRYDLSYWLITHLFERRFMELMGATRDVVANLTADQREHIASFIDWMSPARLRHVGAEFDYRSEVPDRRVAGIRVPTLIVHAADDTLQPFANAELFSSAIPGARLLRFERGGHFVAFIENAAVRAAVREHIIANDPTSAVATREKA